MRIRTRMLVSAAAAVALTVLSAVPAQAGPDKDREPTRVSVAKDDAQAPDRAVAANAVPSSTGAALSQLQGRIAAYVAKNGTRYTFASYVDGTTGKIVLDTTAPKTVVASLLSTKGASAAFAAASSQVQLKGNGVSDAFDRRNDSPPFYGSGGIASGGGICSSGYVVQNSAGTKFMTTAGHCFAVGATVTTEAGAYTYGTVSNRRLPTISGHAQDVELLGGQSYSARVFTGGVTSTTSIPVVAAGAASVGYTNYCHSGRTTGEVCGHTATSTTGQVCTATGCKSPVIVYTGGTSVGSNGDSGGAFYAKDASGAWIRGHFIAFGGGTGYAQPWTAFSSSMGLSIVIY